MRKALALVMLMTSLALAEQLSLVQLWSYKTGDVIEGVAFSENGNLGVASHDSCGYVFDSNGNLLNKICGSYDMDDVSYCCDKFGFINNDDYVYIVNNKGDLINRIYVGDSYDDAITMVSNGFVACGNIWGYTNNQRNNRCAYFSFDGNKIWDLEVGSVDNGPVYYDGYWYVMDWIRGDLIIVRDGDVINKIHYGEDALDVSVCGKYMAAITASHLYLYYLNDPENPEKVWKIDGFTLGWQVTFSPDCNYIAATDWHGNKFRIYSIKGDLILERRYRVGVSVVAWWQDRIAVGLADGRVIVYKLEGYTPFSSEAYTTTTMVMTIKVPITIITTIEVPVTVTVTVPR